MGIDRNREVTLDSYKLARIMPFDSTLAYLAQNIGIWRTNIENLTKKAIVKKMTPHKLLATLLFNIASGHWQIVSDPYPSNVNKTHSIPKNERTPQQCLEGNYLTIVPAYILELAKCVTTLQDSVAARDYSVSEAQVSIMAQILHRNVVEVPKDVLDFVKTIPKMSDICNYTYDKVGSKGGRGATHMKLKKNISDARIAETFGRFLVYSDNRKPILPLKNTREID